MPSFDFVVIGAGPAGEAAAHKARELGATVAVDRQPLVRRLVPAHRLRALEVPAPLGGASTMTAPTTRGSAPRSAATTWSTAPPGAAEPDDTLARRARSRRPAPSTYRGEGRIAARGRRRGHRPDGTTTTRGARRSSSRSARRRRCRRSTGLAETQPWTNREATLARELPRSLLVLGGGPTGCELAQVFARFGVPVTIVPVGTAARPDGASTQRRGRSGSPSSATACTVRTGVRAHASARRGRRRRRARRRPRRRLDRRGPHHPARRGPRRSPSTTWGWSTTASRSPGRTPTSATAGCELADGLWVAGDPAGPELHTHQGHYQGELAVRMALGEAIDARLPRAAAGDVHGPGGGVRGRDPRPGAGAGLDAFECVADFPKTAKGYSVEAETGHVTIVVDRATRELVGRGDGLPGRVRGDPRVRRSRSRRGSPSTSSPRRSTRSRRRRGSSTGCSRRRGRRSTRCDPGRQPPTEPRPTGASPPRRPPVDEHQPRPRVPQRAADLDGLVDRRRREHDEVGAVARHEPSAVGLARAERRVQACGADRAPQRERVGRARAAASRPARTAPPA